MRRYLFFFVHFIVLLALCTVVFAETEESDTSYSSTSLPPTPEPIRGEKNAPENIYYKFIRNHPSDGFFYSYFESDRDAYYFDENDIIDPPLIIRFIIPLKGNDAILLIETHDTILQYSIVYRPNWLLFTDRKDQIMLFATKYYFYGSTQFDINYFLHRQLEIDFRLINKYLLLALLDNSISHTKWLFIDDSSPGYIRRQN